MFDAIMTREIISFSLPIITTSLANLYINLIYAQGYNTKFLYFNMMPQEWKAVTALKARTRSFLLRYIL